MTDGVVTNRAHAAAATNRVPDRMMAALLKTFLLSSDDAILVTDLEHRTLACNDRFGEYFDVEPSRATCMEPEELREKVYPRLKDPQAWRDHLEQIYARPEETHRDELELIGDRGLILRRTTGPVVGTDGAIVGRLWTFHDITEERRRQRMRESLYEVSTCNQHDPAQVCSFIVNKLAEFYDAMAILSIRQGDKMLFREVAGVPLPLSHIRENKLKDSYCQLALKTVKPLFVQDAMKRPDLKQLLPAKVGFTRYLGAPVFDSQGGAIGTLCFMDAKTGNSLTDDDVQFVSMLAMRISNELERERIYLERTAEQRTTLERQAYELAETQQVLMAMNTAFQMAGRSLPTEKVVEEQVLLLQGVLGYDSAALLICEPETGLMSGGYVTNASRGYRTLEFDLENEPAILSYLQRASAFSPIQITFEEQADGPLAKLVGTPFLAAAALPLDEKVCGLLVLGAEETPDLGDQRHLTHLEALVDQVVLLLTSHFLNRQLVETHEELRTTHLRLIQSEKLSVVGTLAASIAHDIRNIVSSVSMVCELGDADPANALRSVRVQIDRFALLAHRLLSYARPRLVSRSVTDVNELLYRVLSIVAPQMRISAVHCEEAFAEDLPQVSADQSQMEHLFVNLVLNAIQAMPMGGRLVVRTLGGPTGVAVEIADTGGGFNDEVKRKLFEPFYSTRGEGFGLGLFSCKRICDEHGWQIEVDSRVARGTTFKIIMPKESYL